MTKEKVEKNSHLVDKWVLLDSVMIGGIVGSRPKLVTKVSGNRVYVSRRTPVVQGKVGELEEDSYVGIKKVQYVFESEDKANEAAAQCRTIWSNWFEYQQGEMAKESRRILKELSIG